MNVLGLFIASLLLGTNASPPALQLPAPWKVSNAYSGDKARVQSFAPDTTEKFAGLITYTAVYKGSYNDVASIFRNDFSCNGKMNANMLESIHVCGGFVVDRDERCAGLTAHRIVRIGNIGPPMLYAQTLFFIPWHTGYLEVEYERQATKYASDGKGGERDDDVLTAVRALCAAAASPVSNPSAPAAGKPLASQPVS